MRIRAALARLLLVALAASACATTLPPIGPRGRVFIPAADEQALWARGERETAAILERLRLDEDPALTAYLDRLADRLTPAGMRVPGAPILRLAVIRDPTLGAFALPEGRLFVTTGLLAAVQSEAQLALVLARQIGHVVGRHALGVARGGDLPSARAGALGALGPTAAAIVGADAGLVSLAARQGYGDRLERDADAFALDALAAGGWEAGGAVEVYAVLAREAGERGALETLALGMPARLRERLTVLRALARARRLPPGAGRTTDEFEARRLAVILDNAPEDIRAGRFDLARRQLDHVLAAAPEDARVHLQDGDWHRLRAQRLAPGTERQAELESAQAGYARALAIDPALAETHRQLGLLYYQERDVGRARAELQEYLRLAGAAPDAARIAEYVRELAR